METTLTNLIRDDYDAVNELMKKHSRTLGFLPKEAILGYIDKGWVIGAKTESGKLAGYLLYSDRISYFRITHLCVSDEFQGQGLARKLVDDLKELAITQYHIKLNCRRDFRANDMWPKLGFVAIGEKPSRSKVGHKLTIWQLTLAKSEQLEFSQINISTDLQEIIIDAQIFFDFDEPDSDKTMPSKALLSDSLVDSIDICITDELFNEIQRQKDEEKRNRSLNRAHISRQIQYNPKLVDGLVKQLKNFLQDGKPNENSDIRHLAKAAASNVRTFVTRDRYLLNHSETIFNTTGIDVISPTKLIIQYHEMSDEQSYLRDRISGLHLRWERLKSSELMELDVSKFQNYQEKAGKFREKLEASIVDTNQPVCELLKLGNENIAIRVRQVTPENILKVSIARIANSTNNKLFGRFMIADILSMAVEKNINAVMFESSLTPSLESNLIDMGFKKFKDVFVRFCFSRCYSREEILSETSKIYPETTDIYNNMSDLELEQNCSPLLVRSTAQNYFLIPIKPEFAMHLFDRDSSSEDLFGGDPNILLRCENVYYRSKTCHKMLKPPARILWYVSGNQREIRAISSLDEVEINRASELFRKFKNYGILTWKDIYKMCDQDPYKELMTLKFSHTFLFRKSISLDDLREVYYNNNAGLSLQAPSRVSPVIFYELYQKGFHNTK